MSLIATRMSSALPQSRLLQGYRGLLGRGLACILIPVLLGLLALAANPSWHQSFHQASAHHEHSPSCHAESAHSPSDPHPDHPEDNLPESCGHCAVTELGLGHAMFVLMPASLLGVEFSSPRVLLPPSPVLDLVAWGQSISERGPPSA